MLKPSRRGFLKLLGAAPVAAVVPMPDAKSAHSAAVDAEIRAIERALVEQLDSWPAYREYVGPSDA